jgi:hypothetical protein
MHALLGTLTFLLLAASLGSAADKKDPPAQPQRTSECTAQAGDRKLTDDARKQFMTDCLKSASTSADAGTVTAKAPRAHKSEEAGHSSQTEKMKTCNQEATAKNLHKDDRRQFMSECLKGGKKS